MGWNLPLASSARGEGGGGGICKLASAILHREQMKKKVSKMCQILRSRCNDGPPQHTTGSPLKGCDPGGLYVMLRGFFRPYTDGAVAWQCLVGAFEASFKDWDELQNT